MADKSYKLKFTLSNSTNIEAGTVVAKQGAKGSKGATGDPGADHRTVTFSSSGTAPGGNYTGVYFDTKDQKMYADGNGVSILGATGAKGATGDKGDKGATGDTGATVHSMSLTEV